MAGIGVKLNKIYEKKTLLSSLSGIAYSVVVTVAPMILVIGTVFAQEQILGFDEIGYNERELFSCSLLYIFIFSLIITSVLNAVLSRFMSDVIYEETYDDIMPCFYFGLAINSLMAFIPGLIFCLHEFFAGGVDPLYILATFIGYMALVFVFYSMMYLSICKDYARMSLFYFIGMAVDFLVSLLLAWVFGVSITVSMLIGLDVAFVLIGGMEFALIRHYFRTNSHNYAKVAPYFKQYWWLIASNTLYIAGLYIHNFVFWTTDLRIIVRNSFICAEPYDMATFLGLATNISATVIFITSVERKFHPTYRAYSEAVIGGRLADIEIAQKRMFTQLSSQLLELVRMQFIISVAVFLVCVVFMPQMGLSGLVMQIYPMVAAAYFILFIMYGALIFLYYFNDLPGALLTSGILFAVTFIMSIVSTKLHPIWYGLGIFSGSLAAWIIAYFRLRWVERNMDRHIFCEGHILDRGKGIRPEDLVYRKGEIEPEPAKE